MRDLGTQILSRHLHQNLEKPPRLNAFCFCLSQRVVNKLIPVFFVTQNRPKQDTKDIALNSSLGQKKKPHQIDDRVGLFFLGCASSLTLGHFFRDWIS